MSKFETPPIVFVYEEKIEKLQEENKRLREILLDAGAKTHKSKMLHDWYCENAVERIRNGEG